MRFWGNLETCELHILKLTSSRYAAQLLDVASTTGAAFRAVIVEDERQLREAFWREGRELQGDPVRDK